MKQRIQVIAAENGVSVNTQTLLLLAEQLGYVARLGQASGCPVELAVNRMQGEQADESVLAKLRELADAASAWNRMGERECWFFDGLPKEVAGENPTKLLQSLKEMGILKAERGRLNAKRPHPLLKGVRSAEGCKVRCVVLDYSKLMATGQNG